MGLVELWDGNAFYDRMQIAQRPFYETYDEKMSPFSRTLLTQANYHVVGRTDGEECRSPTPLVRLTEACIGRCYAPPPLMPSVSDQTKDVPKHMKTDDHDDADREIAVEEIVPRRLEMQYLTSRSTSVGRP